MNCTRIEQLIPLYVGAELNPTRIDQVRRHMEICAHCREIVAEFEESQSWLSGFAAPKFNEAIFDDLRDAVRREIAQIELRPSFIDSFAPFWNPRFVVGGSIAMLLLIGGFVIYTHRRQSPNKPVIVSKEEVKSPTPSPQRQQHKAQGGPQRNHGHVAKKKSIPQGGRQTAVDTDIAINQTTNRDREPEMLRIEIQTADPNIRIIWLAPKDSNTSSTKPNTNDR